MMNFEILVHCGVLSIGVVIACVSQVLLKLDSRKKYSTVMSEYINYRVIFAYLLFLGSTCAAVFAYKKMPLSIGVLIEATSYIYITIFGYVILGESINVRKIVGLILIVIGIILSVV